MKAIYAFPFGNLCIETHNGKVCRIYCTDEAEQSGDAYTDFVWNQIQEYINGKRTSFEFAYEMQGTDFQKKVWQALLDIPYGQTRSYKDIAQMIGKPNASRAVGMANHKNPLLLVVPCHRVIGTNGNLMGYAGGFEMKKYLLDMEKENLQE